MLRRLCWQLLRPRPSPVDTLQESFMKTSFHQRIIQLLQHQILFHKPILKEEIQLITGLGLLGQVRDLFSIL